MNSKLPPTVVADQSLFQAFLDGSPLPLCCIDLEGCVLAVSDGFLRLLELSREQLLGQPLQRFCAQHGGASLQDVILQVSAGEEFRMQFLAAAWHSIEMHFSPLLGAQGAILAVRCQGFDPREFCIALDESQASRRLPTSTIEGSAVARAEQALALSEQRFKDFATASSDWFWETDENQVLRYLSENAVQHTNLPLEQYLGKSLGTLLNGEEPADGYELVASIAARRSFRNIVIRCRDDGSDRWLAVSGVPLHTDEGGYCGCRGSVTDITEQRKAQLALKIALDENTKLIEKFQAENSYLQEELADEHNRGEIIGNSVQMTRVLAQIEQVAPTDVTVLILGETGTGKELIARALHRLSPRSNRPLIKINCGAIPENLIESELFGYERGAFTGATKSKPGRFELAEGGTLLLDEVGDLPQSAQVKLLRVLQEKEFERVGGSRTIGIDARVIAATNRDLEQLIAAGAFREDLYYRLNVLPVQLPPIRERSADIPALANHFLRQAGKRFGKNFSGFSRRTMDSLIKYRWPGNIREMQNLIERAAVLARGSLLDFALPNDQESTPVEATGRELNDVERAHILRTLEDCNWIISGPRGAARTLGLNPSTLRFRMKKLGVQRPAK